MSSSWLLHERGRIGEEENVWELSRKASLRVGRSGDCGIVLENQTVEPHHAELLWNHKSSSFVVRDLGSVNGTYINNCPLRGSSASLAHNDALRFGYDKDRVFRIEEQCSSSKTHSAKKTSSSAGPVAHHESVSTAPTSPLPVSTVAMPTAVTVPASHDLVGVVNGVGVVYNSSLPQHQQPHYQSVALPLTTQGYMYTTTPTLAPGISVVPGCSTGHIPFRPSPIHPECHSHSSSSSSPAHQQYFQDPSHLQTTSHSSSSSSLDPADSTGPPSVYRSDGRRAVNLEQSPALNQASKLYGEPSWWGNEKECGTRTKDYEFSRPGSQILRDIDPERGRNEKDMPFKLSSKDELRLQTIAGSRSQDNVAPISPPDSSWTVDFGGGSGGGGGGNTLPRMVRSRERLSRPRSADPSPNRLQGRRDVSPLPNRAITPNATPTASVRRRSSLNSGRRKPNPVATSLSPQHKLRAATPPVMTTPLSPARKAHGSVPLAGPPSTPRKQRSATPPVNPASPARRRANTAVSSYRSPVASFQKQGTKATAIKKERSSGNRSPTHPPLPNKLSAVSNSSKQHGPSPGMPKNHLKPSLEDKAESEGGESTYVVAASDDSSSLSSLSDPSFTSASDSVVIVTPESMAKQKVSGGVAGARAVQKKAESVGEGVAGKEERRSATGSSGRKQWIEDDTQPCTDTLMMASIEARMRRLGQLSHQTARQATALKSTIQEGRPMAVQAVDYLTMRTSSPVMNKIEQSLPEWKSFNKEANSIFRNIRIVEKWLQDIDANLKCIRPADGAANTTEAVDYFSNDSNEEEEHKESTT